MSGKSSSTSGSTDSSSGSATGGGYEVTSSGTNSQARHENSNERIASILTSFQGQPIRLPRLRLVGQQLQLVPLLQYRRQLLLQQPERLDVPQRWGWEFQLHGAGWQEMSDDMTAFKVSVISEYL
ncbi:hypothetical protein LTR56_004211 [Elasticomyces elasticus]|nr:hypothetical protein LTR56_004211 [Elasticomyces elasticus]KAK3655100.1 hypothetical protein LTR22_010410 [Elasticomyces elasticus]KAK4910895.1 hypothetical protein LTR49_020507 [Elasticomyces elasticus]KAK5750314.1 hypothetical protein LTS12_019653 [Elasticomyces elasticus]